MTTTLYEKVGKRYKVYNEYFNEKGLPCGLYLFYKPNDLGEHKAMKSMIHYAKVHDIKNVGKFCDLLAGHEDNVAEAIRKTLQKEVFL